MPGTVKELVGNNKLQRFVFLFQRPYCGNRDDTFNPQLLEAINIGAKVQLSWQDAVAAAVPRQKRHFLALERA